jgi:hypothetical protein
MPLPLQALRASSFRRRLVSVAAAAASISANWARVLKLDASVALIDNLFMTYTAGTTIACRIASLQPVSLFECFTKRTLRWCLLNSQGLEQNGEFQRQTVLNEFVAAFRRPRANKRDDVTIEVRVLEARSCST